MQFSKLLISDAVLKELLSSLLGSLRVKRPRAVKGASEMKLGEMLPGRALNWSFNILRLSQRELDGAPAEVAS